MKKKIMFFMYSLAGGGAERTVVNIINNLDRNKYKILLVIGTEKNNDYLDLVPRDVEIINLDSKRLRYCIFKLTICILKQKPNLLFSTVNQNNIILLISRLLTFKRIPIVVREANNRTQSGKVTKFNKLLTFLLYNSIANKVIALSRGVKNDLVNNFYVREDKIEVIYNPIEIGNIKHLSNEKIDDFYKTKNEKIIIAVGRLVEQKDFKTLIKAFSIVTKEIKSRLLILGKGPLESELKKLCESLGIKDKVIFAGFKKNPYKYMKLSDVFVLSSKWEGFGHVIVEAMAVGTPVISTNCKSGPSEIIKDNQYGILVPVNNYKILADEIIRLLSNNHLMKKYKEKGLIRSKDFNALNITKMYEKVFDELLKI